MHQRYILSLKRDILFDRIWKSRKIWYNSTKENVTRRDGNDGISRLSLTQCNNKKWPTGLCFILSQSAKRNFWKVIASETRLIIQLWKKMSSWGFYDSEEKRDCFMDFSSMTMLVSFLVNKQFFQSVVFALHNHLRQVIAVQSRNQLIISRGKNDCKFLICARTKIVLAFSTCFWKFDWAITQFYPVLVAGLLQLLQET